jgi:hypothetical protein
VFPTVLFELVIIGIGFEIGIGFAVFRVELV